MLQRHMTRGIALYHFIFKGSVLLHVYDLQRQRSLDDLFGITLARGTRIYAAKLAKIKLFFIREDSLAKEGRWATALLRHPCAHL